MAWVELGGQMTERLAVVGSESVVDNFSHARASA
jgi:hypothetical protein